jgi:hypothetical protein
MKKLAMQLSAADKLRAGLEMDLANGKYMQIRH